MYILRRHPHRVYSTTPGISPSTAALVSGWKAQIAPHIDTSTDHISPSTFNLLATTLDDPVVPYKGDSLPPAGTPLPPNWHLTYFPPRILERDLSLDGYETTHSPPEPFVQRMWAGGRIQWSRENPLKVGQEARMVTRFKDVEVKRGKRGESVFVWVDRDVSNEAGWCLKDTRCLVYMPKTEGGERAEPRVVLANKTPDFTRTLHPTTILLFRYSALTFNSHLIHYDHLYSTSKEGYSACLVHGPLTCTLLLDLLRCNLPTTKHIKSFSYRALSPLVVGKVFRICGRQGPEEGGYELWAENESGGLAMTGTAEVEM